MFNLKPEHISLAISTVLIQIQAVALFFVILVLLYFTAVNGSSDPFSKRFGVMRLASGAGMAALFSFLFFREWGIDHVLLSLDFGIGLVLSFLNPVNALCLFVAGQFLRPWEVMEPNDLILALPRLLGEVALGSWVLHDLLQKQLKFVWNTSTTFLLFFAGWAFITTFKAPDPDFSQDVFMDGMTRNLMLFVLVSNMIRTKWQLNAVLLTTVFSVAGVAMVAIAYSQLSPEDALEGGRLKNVSMMGNSNDLAALMVMALPVMVIRFWHHFKEKLWPLFFPLGMLILSFLAVVWWSKSRGAIVALAVVLGQAFLRQIKSRKKAIVVACIMAGTALVLISALQRSKDDVGESSSSRALYWKTAVYMAAKNPLFGVGFAGYPASFERYTPEPPTEWGYRTAHSSWFLVLGEMGFVGLFLYLLLFILSFRIAWRVRNRSTEIFPMLLAYAGAMTFLSHSYLTYPYFILGLVIAAGKVDRNSIEPLSLQPFGIA